MAVVAFQHSKVETYIIILPGYILVPSTGRSNRNVLYRRKIYSTIKLVFVVHQTLRHVNTVQVYP